MEMIAMVTDTIKEKRVRHFKFMDLERLTNMDNQII